MTGRPRRQTRIKKGNVWIKWILLLFLMIGIGDSHPMILYAQSAAQESKDVDVGALSKEIQELAEGYDYPDFSSIFQSVLSLRFDEALEELASWFFQALTYEFSSSKILVGELVGVILFSAIFSNISSSFQQFAISDSGFLISYFITFTIIFSNFTIMASLFQNTVVLLSRLLKMIIPVYTLTVTLSGHLSTGITIYEYFMLLVLITNWICVSVVLPLIQYYLLLELLNHFSGQQNISKLCDSLYFALSKGMKLLFFVFFGFHMLETMVVPSFDASKTSLLHKMVGLIPGAGSIAQTVTGTVLGSSIMIKNTMGVTAIIFVLLFLAIPILKLLLYILLYLLLAILLEPVADERFIKCITAAQKSGVLLVYALCMVSSLFILTIAVTSLATNQV